MRRPMVAGNWKMHGSRAANSALLTDLELRVKADWPIDVAVFAPFVYLPDAVRMLTDSSIAVGAQNVCAETSGAFTGEVAAAMLKDIGCSHVLIGHSERRAWYHEDDALIARKIIVALATGLTPILCVGETLQEREAEKTEAVIARQIDAVLKTNGAPAFSRLIVAYEPVWAIGTGRTATPDQAQAVHQFIRGRISGQDANIGGQVRLLYGGSVKAGNAADLFSMPDVDGGLVGGASLNAEEFADICAAAAARH